MSQHKYKWVKPADVDDTINDGNSARSSTSEVGGDSTPALQRTSAASTASGGGGGGGGGAASRDLLADLASLESDGNKSFFFFYGVNFSGLAVCLLVVAVASLRSSSSSVKSDKSATLDHDQVTQLRCIVTHSLLFDLSVVLLCCRHAAHARRASDGDCDNASPRNNANANCCGAVRP